MAKLINCDSVGGYMTADRSGNTTEETVTLRYQAEEQLRLDKIRLQTPPTEEEARRLVHELQIHQLELQMQNEQLREARDELESANVDLEAFNFTVAHDLRKYLTTISGYCQIIRELHGKELEKHCREYLEEIYQGTLGMDSLIDSLLEFSSVTKVAFRRESISLSAIVKDVVADLVLTHPESRTAFHITPGIMVEGDPDLFRVVLVNLIGNAWKYAGAREGAIIEFGTTSRDGEQVCFVRDNGPGFDMELAQRLFLPFQKLPGASDEGHGIGLATVERIVKRHGGTVWAESETGIGATFFFTCA
ncbi:MAG: sensor histidine kinase [Desulfuromonadaceae bacterium]